MVKEMDKCVLKFVFYCSSNILVKHWAGWVESRIRNMDSAIYPKETGNEIGKDQSSSPLL